MERPDIIPENEEIKAYIDYLEGKLNGMSRLVAEINLLKDGVAADLEKVRLGTGGDNGENLKYVCFDKSNPRFNHLKYLMLSINIIESKPVKATLSKEDEVETVVTTTKKRINIQDFATRNQ